MEDSPTMEAESAMVLDGLAGGVDHLEAIVVFFLSVSHAYASWVRAGVDLKPPRIATSMREAYVSAEQALFAIDGEPQIRTEAPNLTIETQGRLVFVHRVRTFGVAVCFERDAPLGFARMAARQLIRTLEHELPYPQDDAHVVVVTQAKPTSPSAPAAPPQLDFDPEGNGPDTHPPRHLVGDRVRHVIRHLEENAPDPHLIRLRVALRTGLGLEAIQNPDQLTPDALLLVESAAEDILGIDHGKLTEVGA